MARRLKCSKCGGHSAYKTWGFNPSIGRKYTQKICPSCGNKQPKSYYGRTMTQQEYAEFHKHLADTLV